METETAKTSALDVREMEFSCPGELCARNMHLVYYEPENVFFVISRSGNKVLHTVPAYRTDCGTIAPKWFIPRGDGRYNAEEVFATKPLQPGVEVYCGSTLIGKVPEYGQWRVVMRSMEVTKRNDPSNYWMEEEKVYTQRFVPDWWVDD